MTGLIKGSPLAGGGLLRPLAQGGPFAASPRHTYRGAQFAAAPFNESAVALTLNGPGGIVTSTITGSGGVSIWHTTAEGGRATYRFKKGAGNCLSFGTDTDTPNGWAVISLDPATGEDISDPFFAADTLDATVSYGGNGWWEVSFPVVHGFYAYQTNGPTTFALTVGDHFFVDWVDYN